MAGKKGGRNGHRNGNSGIPFDGEKPQYTERKLEFNTRFNERLDNYAKHYKEVKGRECDLGILVANIVDSALNSDSAFVQKENSGQFDGSAEAGARTGATRPAARTTESAAGGS